MDWRKINAEITEIYKLAAMRMFNCRFYCDNPLQLTTIDAIKSDAIAALPASLLATVHNFSRQRQDLKIMLSLSN